MSQDDELVELLAQDKDDDEASPPVRWSEFSPEVEAIYAAVDRLSDVVAGQVALGGKKPPRLPAMRRPETAWTRVKRKKRDAKHDRLKAMLLPNGPQPLPEDQQPETG